MATTTAAPATAPLASAPLAPAPLTPAPLTEEAFLADRQQFFGFFTGLTFYAATGVAVLLILLAIFLL